MSIVSLRHRSRHRAGELVAKAPCKRRFFESCCAEQIARADRVTLATLLLLLTTKAQLAKEGLVLLLVALLLGISGVDDVGNTTTADVDLAMGLRVRGRVNVLAESSEFGMVWLVFGHVSAAASAGGVGLRFDVRGSEIGWGQLRALCFGDVASTTATV